LANTLAASGRDFVRVAHLPTDEARLASSSEIPWFTFHPSVEHEFLPSLDPAGLPEADVVLYTVMGVNLCLAPDAGRHGRRLLEQLQADESPAGLPMIFVQTLDVFPKSTELRALSCAGPKICVASWIADNLIRGGLPASEVVHVGNGVNHDTFRVTRPIEGRSPRIAMNYNNHPLKNIDAGVDVLERLDRDMGVPSVLFGTRFPLRPPSTNMRFVQSPRQREVAEEILASSSVYLQPSTQEGFGMCAVEAMACGCALVTTDNGGSDDYAVDGETAIVCSPDLDSMAEAVERLLRDEGLRVRIATNGVESVQQLTWERSASGLREVAVDYLADPSSFRKGAAVEVDESALQLRR
jgi:hypothetical protein